MASSPEAAANNGQPIALKRSISDPASTTDFTGFVTQKKKLFIGRNGYDQEQSFIPSCELDNYWKKQGRIQEICKSYSPNVLVPPRQAIRETYLRVFSTLVFAGWLPLFPGFLEVGLTDEQFPTNSLPAIWTDSPIHQEMFEDFKKYQWTFFPVILDSNKLVNTAVPPERILPISNRLVIRESDATLISKVDFHRSCVKPHHDVTSPADSNATSTYIIKTYKGERYRRPYLDEFHAYYTLQSNKPANVITCYGAFRHGDTSSLILQWVPPGCNLNEFLERMNPPQCAQDLSDFWESLVQTLVGLHHLHQVIQDADCVGYRLVHQDIKLDNILLEFDPDSGQRLDGLYKFTPYIADLGNSHVARLNSQNTAPPAIDRRGNQLYCAPEATRDAGSTWAGTSYLTWKADIFSMGAVMSDVATWVVLGQEGRKLYHEQRLKETNSLPGFRESGYEGTFHNGAGPLDCVTATHELIRRSLPPWDKITNLVLDVIDSEMLTSRRRPAKNLHYMLMMKLQKGHEHQNAQEATPGLMPTAEASGSSSRLDPMVQTTPTPPVPGLIHSPDIAGSVPRFCMSPEISHDSGASSPMTPSSNPISPWFHTESLHGHSASMNGWDPSSSGHAPINKLTRPAFTPASASALGPPAEITKASSASESCTPRSRSTSDVRLSMDDCLEYVRARKDKMPVAPSTEAIIAQLKTNLGPRDHIFLIDDTPSMSEHSEQIVESFGALAYIAKGLDPNGLELVFASEPRNIHKKKRTKPLVEILKNHDYSAFPGGMETSLGIVTDDLIIPRLPSRVPVLGRLVGPHARLHPKPPVTVFVFTDGKWGSGVKVGNGLDAPISRLMEKIQSRGLNRTQVMIQFLRFGEDKDGLAHLRFLDGFGRDKGCDIVDMRDITDDVSSMFHASYTQAGDDDHISGKSTPRSQIQSPVVGFPIEI